uniref:Thyroxine-binding globulin n=1 Tax=Saimiri boliviensis boliviensis TaxID=39432 RepID=A0A2K6U8Z2_SAIBB
MPLFIQCHPLILTLHSTCTGGSLLTPDKNIFCISAALAVLSFGSYSSTQTEIMETLGFNLTDTPMLEIQQGFQNLICSLNFPKKELELQIGNVLFIGEHLKPLAKFLDDVKTLYETEQDINSHVEMQTKGNVVGLIQALIPNAIMILVNYIHFKGKTSRCQFPWANPFYSSKTEDSSSFLIGKTTTVQAPLMYSIEQYYHLVDMELNCTVLQTDYRRNALVFFVLPKEEQMESVEAFVPKFSISATYDLGATLLKMGIQHAYAENAEFYGLTEDNGLKLSNAAHKAVLHIGEKGTEVAAVPEVELEDQPENTLLHPIIQLDRSFMLLILERSTKSTLFLGKVVNPVEV